MVDSAKQFLSMVHALDLIPLGSTEVDARGLVMLAPPVNPERADVRGPIRITQRKTR